MAKHPRRPRDPNQLAAMVVGLSVGELVDEGQNGGKDPAAIARGRKGGARGGKSRAAKLSAKRRAEIARKAAAARWKRRP